MTQTAARVLGIALVASMFACKLTREPPGLPTGPVCVAQNAEKQEVRCPAASNAYSGDNCTCVNAETRAAFWGRVQGGR
jgi:hypothetical protein